MSEFLLPNSVRNVLNFPVNVPEEKENPTAKRLKVIMIVHLRHRVVFYIPKYLHTKKSSKKDLDQNEVKL